MTETAATRSFVGSLEDLGTAAGASFGPSTWVSVTQERIWRFASATDDHQWIHVDADRAARGPFGSTIAHGYLTLSLVPRFLSELVDVHGTAMGVNYGLNKVRFPAPVPSDSKINATITIGPLRHLEVGAQVTFDVTIRAAGIDKPVCVAQVVVLYA